MRIKIRDIRTRLGVSQTELAARCGISRPFLAQLESGKRNLTAERQDQIAKALNINASELVDFLAPPESDKELLVEAFWAATPSERKMLMSVVAAILEDGDQG